MTSVRGAHVGQADVTAAHDVKVGVGGVACDFACAHDVQVDVDNEVQVHAHASGHLRAGVEW